MIACGRTIVVLFLCIPIHAMQAANAKYSIREVQQGLRMRAQACTNIGASYNREIYHVPSREGPSDKSQMLVDGPRSREAFDVRLSGIKIRMDYTTYDPKDLEKVRSVSHNAWNGIRNTAYTEWYGNQGLLGGTMGNARSFTLEAGHHLTVLEKEVLDIHAPLADMVTEDAWIVVGQEIIDGYPTVHISGPAGPRGWELHAWIAVQHGFAPVRYILTLRLPDKKEIIEEMRDVTLGENEGTWVMKKAKILVHNPNVIESICVIDYNITQSKIGESYPDSVFRVQYPKGCKVLDKVTHITYVAKGDGTLNPLSLIGEEYYDLDLDSKLLPDLVSASSEQNQASRAAQEQESGSRPSIPDSADLPPTSSRRRWPMMAVLVCSSMGLIVAGGVLVARRRRRRRRRRT